MKQYAQGDLLLIELENVPSKLNEIKPIGGKTILLEGEATGHAHAFYDNTSIYEEPSSKRRFVVIPGGQSKCLKHEEHGPIELPSGYYEIIRQREYWEDEIRFVQD